MSVALCVALRARRLLYFGVFAAVVVVLQSQSALPVPAVLNTVFHPFMLEFIMGVALFSVSRWPRFKSIQVVWATAAVAVLAMCIALSRGHPDSFERVVAWGGASVLVVALALQLEGCVEPMPFLVFLGDSSYSLYLTHWLVVTTFPSLLDVYGYSAMGPACYVALNVVISLVLAVCVFVLLERPLSRICRQAFRQRRSAGMTG